MFSCLNESIAASAENSWFNSRFQCKRSRQEIALSLARTPFWRGTRRSVESIVKLRERFSLNAKQRARRPSVGQKLIPNGISSYVSMINSYHSVDVVRLPVPRDVGLEVVWFVRGLLVFVDEEGGDDEEAAGVGQANLAEDLLDGFEVGLDDGVLEARGALANEFGGVDVDGHKRFGVVDDDVAAGLQPNFSAQGFVELVLDAELLEDGCFLGVELDLVDKLRL